MKTVKEVSDLSGVSVRTLHHYDSIGLLKPDKVTDAGYRLYGNTAILKLQSIMLLKEAGLSLASIKQILSNSENDKKLC